MDITESTGREEQEKKNDPYSPERREGQSLFAHVNETGQAQQKKIADRREKYKVDLPAYQYDQLDTLIESIPDAGERRRMAVDMACAMDYSKKLDIPLDEAYQNLDSLRRAQFGDAVDAMEPKNFFAAMGDAWTIGNNQKRISEIGLELMTLETGASYSQAGSEQKEAYRQSLINEYQTLLEDTMALQDRNPNFLMKGLEGAVQSARVSIEGGVLAAVPVVGPALSFGMFSVNETGRLYIDARMNGASITNAATVSTFSGVINGAIETALGDVAGAAGSIARGFGLKAGGEVIRDSVIKNIEQKLFAKWFNNGTFRVMENVLMRAAMQNLEEGSEEALQELTEMLTHQVLRELEGEGYNTETLDAATMTKRMGDAFIMGAWSSVFLGAPVMTLNAATTSAQLKQMADSATNTPSRESFINDAVQSSMFDGMSEESARQTAGDIWERAQARRAREDRAREADYQEIYSADDTMEVIEQQPDEQGNGMRQDAGEAYRQENGRLYTENTTDETGRRGVFSVGNPDNTGRGNRYAHIDYTVDHENMKVTVDAFKMTSHRAELMEEVFSDFAEQFPDFEIEWNPKQALGKSWKQTLVSLNPRGMDAGLSYFTTENIDTEENLQPEARQDTSAGPAGMATRDPETLRARVDLAAQLKNNTGFSARERAGAVAIMEAMANHSNETLAQFMTHFADGIFANRQEKEDVQRQFLAMLKDSVSDRIRNGFEGENAGLTPYLRKLGVQDRADFTEYALAQNTAYKKQGVDINAVARAKAKMRTDENFRKVGELLAKETDRTVGGTQFSRRTQDGMKAVIYVSENGNFSTWVHELAHFYRRNIMSSGELEHVAEVFGIKDRNNWTVAEEERFAEAAEDYFRTGRTEHTGLRDIFDRIAKFVVDAYRNMSRSINMSDDIRSVFDELYQADGSVLRAAEEAVRAADEQTEPAGEQTEPAEEHTDTVRKNERDTVPQEKVSQEAPEEKKTTLPVRAEEYLDNVNASPDVTAQAKTGSALAATGEQYTAEEINEIEALINDYYDSNEGMDTVEGEDNENFYPDELDDEMLFQLIGAKGAAMLDRALVLLGRKDSKGQIISNVKLLESAQALENMGATAEQIKINTLADKDSTQKYWLEIADGSLINKEALNNNWMLALKEACDIYQVRDADRQSQLIADFQQTLSNIKATIGLIYSNPNLFKAYPGLENMPVRFTFEQNAVKGTFSSAGILINYSNIQSVDDLEQTLMHELQHIIQAIEYSDEVWDAFSSNKAEWNYINDILRKAYGNDFEFASFVPREKLLKILENYKDSDRFLKAYNSPWEVQARNVVARSGFSQQMRQSTLLRSTEEFLQHVDGKNISTTLSPDQQAALDRQTQRAETLNKFFGKKTEENRILFQLLGEKGAAALDAAEDRTERMNNLSVAGQMEAAGKDAKTIRLATGWEKGADGKWRYEIADQKAFLLEDYLKQNNSVIREAAAYSEKAAEDLLKFQEEKGGHPAGGRRSGGVKYSEEDLETWNFLETVRRQAQDTLYGHLKEELEKDDLTLDDLMHGTELLKAYPELGDVTVRFAGTYNNGAYFSPEENEIVISPSIASHERPSVLLHEVQHAVQEIEGFSRGGNIQQFTEESEKPTELQEFLLLLHRIPKDDIRNYKEHEEWKILKSYLPDVLEKNIGGLGTLEEIVDRKLRDIEAGFGTVDSLYDEIQESRLAYDRYHRTNGFENEKSPYEKYRSLAGETEARNVQARMRMTPEQRLATLLRETEDVPRQDQTVLFQTIAERKQAQFDLISRENPMTDDYHTGIRSAEEIRTFAEAMEDDESFFYGDYGRSDAERDLARGKVTVYSSKSIMKGDFVSTSRNMARDYAGRGRIYSREVSVDDVAWINGDEGQYAPLSDVLYSVMDGMPLSDMVMNEITAAADSSESAEDFREMCESGWVLSDEAQKDIEGADSAWYRNTWERVKGISPTTYEEQEKGRTEYREATTADPDPIANDSIFFTQMKTRNGMLEGFLRQIAEILGQDAEQWRADALDEEDAAEAEALINLQRRIRSMQNQSVLSNAKRVKNGNPLTDRMRKSILSAIKNKLRDYRGLYALVMQDAQFAVSVSDSGSIELKEYAAANKLDVNVDDMGFSDRAKLADRIREEKISGAVKDGSIVLDGDLEFYRKTLEERTRIAEKKYRDLEQRTKEDYNDLSHAEQRDLLKVYGKLLDLRAEMEVKGIDVPKKADRAIESLSRYNRDLSGIQARYSNLYDQYKDLAKHMETAGELRGKLDRIENLKKVRAEYRRLRQEEHALRELKDLRLRLIRRAMRRVDFRTVDYDAGVALIALQEVFDPNLRSGINRWIRSEEVTAEEIWTDFKTDEDRKQAIIEVLARSKTGEKFIAKLEQTATLGDLESWTEADVRSLERRMMKGNWVKELQLEQLRRGREKAVQLDITRKLKKVATGELDENGDEIYRNENVAEFSDEVYAVMAKHFSDELIEKIQNKPVSMWSLQEMTDLAQAVNEVYRQGKDALNARRMREQADAMQLRDGIRRQVMKTGIVINPDDPEKVKEKKRAKINRMLGLSDTIKGTSDDTSKRQSRWSRIFSGYHDANIRRVARILDGYTEGTATNLLYWQENECWTRQERSKDRRNARIESVLKEAKIDVADLYRTYTVSWTDTSTGLLTEHRLSADDVLFFAQAYRNNESYRQQQRDEGVPEHLIEEESGYQAVVYGNLMNIQEKEQYLRMDESAREAEKQRLMNLRSAQLAGNEELIREYSALTADTHDDKGSLLLPGRQRIVELCRQRMDEIMHLHDMIVQDIPGISRLQDVIAEDYAQEFDRLSRVSIEEFNTPVLREKWYLPLVRLSKTGDTNENRLKQDLLGAVPGTGQAGTDRGMTRSRIRIAPEHQAPVETGLYRTWADSVERNEHFIAYAGYVRTLNKVFMNRDAAPTMQVIEGRYGTGMAEYLKRYVQEVANPDAGRQRTAMDQVIRVFRGNTAPAYLAWKLSSIIKQGLSSPMPYMQFVNPVEYAAAALKVLGSGQVREAIAGRSQFMKSRTFDPIVDVIAEQQAKARNPLAYRLKNFEAKGMAGLEWIDYVCVAPGWLAIYEKEKSKLMKEYDSRLAKRVAELREENGELSLGDRLSAAEIKARAAAELDEDMETAAINRADDCVRLCQPSNRSVDIAPMFKEGGELSKAFLQFQTSLNVIWQNIRYDIPYNLRNRIYRETVGMVCGYVAAGLALGLVCEGLGGDDGSEEDKLRRSIYFATTQFTDSMPIIGSQMSAAMQRLITGEKQFSSGVDLFPTLTKFRDAGFALHDGDYEKAVKKLTDGFAISSGLPYSGARELLYAAGIGDGDGEPGFHPEAFVGRRQ